MTDKGKPRWMLLDGAIRAPALIRFMQRLVRDAGCKVFLVLGPRKPAQSFASAELRGFAGLPVHHARAVQDWLAEHRAEIEVFHLPPCSPELNPDEGLNADLKHTLVSHMRGLSKRPGRVCSHFGHRIFRYAA